MKRVIAFIFLSLLTMPYPAMADFNNPFTPDANTMGLWHFDEVTGSDTAYDETVNNNHAVIDPNATGYGYGPLDPNLTWAPAKFDTGTWTEYPTNVGTLVVPQDVPGTGGNSSLFVDGDFTIEFWMNAPVEGTPETSWQDYILCKGDGSVFNVRFVGHHIEMGWYGGGWNNVADTAYITLGEWHHVAITADNTEVDSTTLTFYIDGNLSTQFTGQKNIIDNPAFGYDLIIHGPANGHPFNVYRGQLDELRISNIVRDYSHPGIPEVKFSSATSSTYEADESTVAVQVELSETSDSVVSVPYTVTGTASTGADYSGPVQASPLVFDPGEMSKDLHITIINDSDTEGDEQIVITQGQPTNADTGSPSVHVVTIVDDEQITEQGWWDTFYQYRIPVSLNFNAAGWNLVDINETGITVSINNLEELKFDPLWFAYNQVEIVETDDSGIIVDFNPDIGFYLVPVSAELFTVPITGGDQEVNIPTEAGAYYLVSYSAAGGGYSPMYYYDQIWPVGSPMRDHAYMSSYEPPRLPHALMEHERLLLSDGQDMNVKVKNFWVTGVIDVSVKKVELVLLADVDQIGQKNYMLYYQPMLGHYLTIPDLRHTSIPSQTATINSIGSAEKYTGETKYSLASNSFFNAWFAETTVKITPNTPPPANSSPEINITSARNEKQSFQVVIQPQQSFGFQTITATDLVGVGDTIPAANISFYAVDYVPIVSGSYLTPSSYTGLIGDPLVELDTKTLSPAEGNHGLWITVEVPPGTPAGTYTGSLSIEGVETSTIVPMTLAVYDFELPEYSTFQSSMGGQFMDVSCRGGNVGYDYHGLTTSAEKLQLKIAMYDVMAENKFTPKNVSIVSASYSWTPPPQGYNVDLPGNYFYLDNWDFTDMNAHLDHYINDLKVNSVLLDATDPIICNSKWLLPDLFAWGPVPGDPNYDITIEITQNQFDQLILDYYRAIAQNLDNHGWLDYVYLFVDEGENNDRILHWMRTLKSDPLTSRIKIIATVQGYDYFTYKENPGDTEYAFNGLLTYVPESDENYQRWEKFFFTDYDIIPSREKLWNYGVTTSRIAIDVPGVTNRITALDMFDRGGSGYYIWETIIYDPGTAGASDNPWIDPNCNWGNGAVAFFYPPLKDGFPTSPDFTITPSLRMMTYREGVDDYEYARILEDLIAVADQEDLDVSEGENVIQDIDRFFYNSVHWSQNDAWYIDLRDRMARAIENLSEAIAVETVNIDINTSYDTITISWAVIPWKNYQLYYSDTIGDGEQWMPVPGSYTVSEGVAVQTLPVAGGTKKRFFKVKLQ